MVFLASTPLQGLVPPKQDDYVNLPVSHSYAPSSAPITASVTTSIDVNAEPRIAQAGKFIQPPSSHTSNGSSVTSFMPAVKKKHDEQYRTKACGLLSVNSASELQDFLASLILCECVYKKVELSQERLAGVISSYAHLFPEGWVQIESVQISLNDVPQHYLIASSGDAMYVAFMGTKQPRDLVVDARILQRPVWAESVALAADDKSVPAAHGGFLQRARAINVQQLYDLASASGRRLVLCGHSLGGAVAKLATLRLLRELPEWPAPRLKCICFATPAVGNSALADLVNTAGWGSYFKTYFLPEDQIMRLASLAQSKRSGAKKKAASISSLTEATVTSHKEDVQEGCQRNISDVLAASNSGVVLTLDDADETAMEEILASFPAGVTVFDASASPCSTTCGYPITDHESRNEAKRASDGEGGIACETEMIMPGRGTKIGQAAVAKRGAAVFNLGLAFALQRKRAMRAMRRLARMAQIKLPLPQVRNFHTFGDQLFIHTSGALLDSQHQSESLDAEGTKEFIISVACKPSVKSEEQVSSSRPTGMEDKSKAAEKTDLTNLVKGPFRYHRMTAYRLRVLSVISTVLPEAQRQTLVAAVGSFEAAGTHTRISPITSSPPVAKDRSLASSHTEALDQSSSSSTKSNASAPPPSPSLLSDELYPKMSVSQAVARLPFVWENGESSPASHLSHLEGPLSSTRKRKDDGRVPLLIEVEGRNLQFFRTVQAKLVLPGSSESELVDTEVVRILQAPERLTLPGNNYNNMSLLQSTWHQFAGSIGRYMVGPRSMVPAVGLAAPVRMVLRVWLPKEASDALVSAAVAKEASFMDLRQHAPLAGGSRERQKLPKAAATSHEQIPAGSSREEGREGVAQQQQPAPRLSLLLRSDFQEVMTPPVAVRPYKAALLGTSAHAASLLQAALLPPPAGVSEDPRQLSRSNSRNSLMSGIHSAFSWWSAPSSLKAGTFTPSTPLSTPSPTQSLGEETRTSHAITHKASSSHSTKMDYLLKVVPRGEEMIQRESAPDASSLTMTSIEADVSPLLNELSAVSSFAPERLEACVSVQGGHDKKKMDGQDSHHSPLAFTHSAALMSSLGQTSYQVGSVLLLPVSGILLVARILQQAATRMVTVQVIGGRNGLGFGCSLGNSSASSQAGAAQMLQRRPGTYASRVYQAGTLGKPISSSPVSSTSWPEVGSAGGKSRDWFHLPWHDASDACKRVVPAINGGNRPSWLWPGTVWGTGRSHRLPGASAQEAVSLDVSSPLIDEGPFGDSLASLFAASICHDEEDASSVTSVTSRSSSFTSASLLSSWSAPFLPPERPPSPLSSLLLQQPSQSTAEAWPSVMEKKHLVVVPGRKQEVVAAAPRGSSPPPPMIPNMRRSISYHGVPVVSAMSGSSRVMNRAGGSGPAAKMFAGLLLSRKKASSNMFEKDGQGALDHPSSSLQVRSKLPKQTSLPNQRLTSRGQQRTGTRQNAVISSGQLPVGSTSLSLPSCSSCLGGSVLVHNVLACVPAASPFVVLRALTAALRRQAARQRRTWWGSLLLGAMPQWQQQHVRQPVLKPAVPLVHFYNFLRGIPLWIRQRRSQGSLTFDQDWKVLLVSASALDPLKVIQGRDFMRMVLRARAAGVALVPVLLTSHSVPEQQRDRALRALAASCGVDEAEISLVILEEAVLKGDSVLSLDRMLRSSATMAITKREVSTEEEEARLQLVSCAPGAAGVRQQLQTCVWYQQQAGL